MKKHFTLSNIFTFLFIGFIIAMLIKPELKAGVIQGLMKIGLFQPDIKADTGKNTYEQALSQAYFTDNNGSSIDVSAQKGKVVFINFWATWCPPCIAEMPSINELYLQFKYSENIIFVMADADNSPEKSVPFMQKKGLSLPVFFPKGTIPSEYFTGSLPTTIIIDKSGKIVFKETGAANYNSDKMVDFIKKLLAE